MSLEVVGKLASRSGFLTLPNLTAVIFLAAGRQTVAGIGTLLATMLPDTVVFLIA